MIKLKIRQIGGAAGAIFPREMLDKLRVGVGDQVYVTESPEGLRITQYDPEFAADMETAEQIMRDHRDTLKVLAK